jgi:hypothetical protein
MTTTTIACPVCAGPVPLTGANVSCLIGHDFEPDDLGAAVADAASRALWSAVRSLEDTVSGARWRMTLPSPPPSLAETIDQAEREAKLLRELLSRREESIATNTRPEPW